jgi:hypothetical protein
MLVAGPAFGQTVTHTLSVAGGTLTYQATFLSGNCFNGSLVTYQQWNFLMVSFTNSSGTQSVVGGMEAYNSPGGNSCPPNGSVPAAGIPVATNFGSIQFTGLPGGLASATFTYNEQLYPKYKVVSVIYTPPGPSSFVDYGTSTALGTSTSWKASVAQGKTLTASLTAGVHTVGTSTTWTQTVENSGSISVNKSSSLDIIIPGPLNANLGVDHDYDLVALWLNPKVDLKVISNTTAEWQYSFDTRDPAHEVDVVYVYVAQLKNPSTMATGLKMLSPAPGRERARD